MRILLVRQARTPWSLQDRIESATTLPALPDEIERLKRLAPELAGFAPAGIHAWDKDPGRASGLALAEALDLPLWESSALAPLDMGAWTGISWQEVRQRFGRIYRQWHADPEYMAAPLGETLAEAAGRLEPLLGRLRKANRDAIVVGSREVLLALRLRCLSAEPERDGAYPWSLFDETAQWHMVNLPEAAK